MCVNKLTSTNVVYVNMTIRRALGAIPTRRTGPAFTLSRLAVAAVAQTSCQVATARDTLAVREIGRAVIAIGAAFAFCTGVTCGRGSWRRMKNATGDIREGECMEIYLRDVKSIHKKRNFISHG